MMRWIEVRHQPTFHGAQRKIVTRSTCRTSVERSFSSASSDEGRDKNVGIYSSYVYVYIYGPFIDGLPIKNGDFLYIYMYTSGWWFHIVNLLMVNGSLMGFNDDLYWLVVEPYPSEKWWSESQLGWFSIPNKWWESHNPFMFQSTNHHQPVQVYLISDHFTMSQQCMSQLV